MDLPRNLAGLLDVRWISMPEPSAKVYWTWLSWSGVALGIVDGIWSGSLTKAAQSRLTASLAGATLACALALLQAAVYGLLLPDALMLLPGQVPQDNFAAWLLGGLGLVPAAVIIGGVSGWRLWRSETRGL